MTIRLFTLLLLLWFDNSYSQTFNKTYVGVASDSLHDDPILVFKNDSIVELTSRPRHMSGQLRLTLGYYKVNNVIIIPLIQLSQTDSTSLITYKFGQFTDTYSVKLDNRCLLDEKNNIIYALSDNYGYNKDFILTWIIDGKKFRQNLGRTDGYGLIRKKPRTNRKLQKRLDSIKDEIKEKYDVKIYKGLAAYQKFGFAYIPGVFVLTKKN